MISKKLSAGAAGVTILAVMQTMLELPWQNQMPVALVIGCYLIAQGIADHGKGAEQAKVETISITGTGGDHRFPIDISSDPPPTPSSPPS